MLLQQLEPASARLCLRVKKECQRRLPLKSGDGALLAVSGGADSLALALIFKIIAPGMGLRLAACHINHNLRREAAADEAHARQFCARLQIPFTALAADVAGRALADKCGIEEAGRGLRLEMLEAQRKAAGADHILTGHHLGDLAEDMLMRIARGAGWPGLGGMGWRSGAILRPLLHVEPEELRAFLSACGFSWREDASNQSLAFKRNRFRRVILPLLRCENPAFNASAANIHDAAQIDADYWERELDKALAANPWRESRAGLLLPRRLLEPMHPALRLRLYHKALNHLRAAAGAAGQNRRRTLQRLEEAFLSGIGGKRLECSGGITALCGKDGILLTAAARP